MCSQSTFPVSDKMVPTKVLLLILLFVFANVVKCDLDSFLDIVIEGSKELREAKSFALIADSSSGELSSNLKEKAVVLFQSKEIQV